jgi:hypothetical protein
MPGSHSDTRIGIDFPVTQGFPGVGLFWADKYNALSLLCLSFSSVFQNKEKRV